MYKKQIDLLKMARTKVNTDLKEHKRTIRRQQIRIDQLEKEIKILEMEKND